MGSIRTACSSVATSIYSSILANQYAKLLPKYVTPAATEAGLPLESLPQLYAGISSGNYSDVSGYNTAVGEAVGHAVKQAYSMSFRTVFLCTIPFGAIILVAALISPNVEQYNTNDVARKLQGKSVAGVKSTTTEEKEVADL